MGGTGRAGTVWNDQEPGRLPLPHASGSESGSKTKRSASCEEPTLYGKGVLQQRTGGLRLVCSLQCTRRVRAPGLQLRGSDSTNGSLGGFEALRLIRFVFRCDGEAVGCWRLWGKGFCRPSRGWVLMRGRNPALTRWAIICRPSGPGATALDRVEWIGFVSLVSFVEKSKPSNPSLGAEPADASIPPGLFPLPTSTRGALRDPAIR
jgi:hypothetical protein